MCKVYNYLIESLCIMSIDKHLSVCYNYYRKKGKELSSMTKTNTICYRTYDGNEYLAYYFACYENKEQQFINNLSTKKFIKIFEIDKKL